MIIRDFLHTSLLNENSISYTIVMSSAPQKTCLWLHGFQERANDILIKSNLRELSEKHRIAFLLPDVPDTYYLNQSWNHCYIEQFLINEFLPEAITKYHLPSDKSHTLIGGISMGGFGSLLIGSHFPNLFGRIVSISGAFIIDDILIGNPEVIGSPNNIGHFLYLFGNLPSLEKDTDRNPEAAALITLKNSQLPPIFMSCGKQDLLYKRNLKLRNHLLAHGANLHWTELPGNHEWKCFNEALNEAFHLK